MQNHDVRIPQSPQTRDERSTNLAIPSGGRRLWKKEMKEEQYHENEDKWRNKGTERRDHKEGEWGDGERESERTTVKPL